MVVPAGLKQQQQQPLMGTGDVKDVQEARPGQEMLQPGWAAAEGPRMA